MRIKDIITENTIKQSTKPKTMSLWHGGNLEITPSYKVGRVEYGPGLYLITRYDVAQKYSKGSRKLYLVTIEEGNNANDTFINLDTVLDFINTYGILKKRKDVSTRLEKIATNGQVRCSHLINIIINEDALKTSSLSHLRDFLVENKCDYELVSNPFGWNDAMMVVLFNMKKITNIQIVKPKDKIEVFDLPPNFN